MKRIFFLVLTATMLSMMISKQSVSWSQIRPLEFIEYDLENGLHVILHRDVSIPIVAVTVMYHVGSKNENPSRTGFAHFFEHLLFEGSKNIKRGEYSEYVTNAGGELNANTTFDRTFYYEVLPSNQLELGLWLESERMLHAHIDEEGVETQREVVKEESRQRYDNQPYGSFFREMYANAFKEHPYRWIPIGSIEHLNKATLEEFIEFYKTFYVPDNATLSIAGDLDIEQTKEWIDYYFSSIHSSGKPVPRPNIVEPKQNEERRKIIYDNIQLEGVFYGYHMPVQGSKDYYSFQVLSLLLSGGQSSRLYKNLVDKEQSAVFVGSFPLATEDPGLYLVYAIANAGIDANRLEESLDKDIDAVKNSLVSEYEFQKVFNGLERQFIESRSGVAAIAENLANYQMYFGDANLINTEFERYKNVTREDIKEVASKYLVSENRVVLHYLPVLKKKISYGSEDR